MKGILFLFVLVLFSLTNAYSQLKIYLVVDKCQTEESIVEWTELKLPALKKYRNKVQLNILRIDNGAVFSARYNKKAEMPDQISSACGCSVDYTASFNKLAKYIRDYGSNSTLFTTENAAEWMGLNKKLFTSPDDLNGQLAYKLAKQKKSAEATYFVYLKGDAPAKRTDLKISVRDSVILKGDQIKLEFPNNTPGNTYTWQPGGSHAPFIYVTPEQTTDYQLQVSIGQDCPMDTLSQKITVIPCIEKAELYFDVNNTIFDEFNEEIGIYPLGGTGMYCFFGKNCLGVSKFRLSICTESGTEIKYFDYDYNGSVINDAVINSDDNSSAAYLLKRYRNNLLFKFSVSMLIEGYRSFGDSPFFDRVKLKITPNPVNGSRLPCPGSTLSSDYLVKFSSCEKQTP